jgi:hypothetical protein
LKYIYENTTYEGRSSGTVMNKLFSGDTNFNLSNKILKPCLDINSFFERIKNRIISLIRDGYDIKKLGLKKENILADIEKSKCSNRDKWLVFRIFNLSVYLTHLEKERIYLGC